MCNKVEIVGDFMCCIDGVSAGGGCEVAVICRIEFVLCLLAVPYCY